MNPILRFLSQMLILPIRIHNGIPIKTPMLIELGVLVINDSSNKIR